MEQLFTTSLKTLLCRTMINRSEKVDGAEELSLSPLQGNKGVYHRIYEKIVVNSSETTTQGLASTLSL